MQGNLTDNEIKELLKRPLPAFDAQEWDAWAAKLPRIGKTKQADIDFWRELDAMAMA